MKIGLYAHTHGFGHRDGHDELAKSILAIEMRPVEVARRAMQATWFEDHVWMPTSSAIENPP